VLRSALPSAARWLEPPARISRTLYTQRTPVADFVKILPFSSAWSSEGRCGPVRRSKIKGSSRISSAQLKGYIRARWVFSGVPSGVRAVEGGKCGKHPHKFTFTFFTRAPEITLGRLL
jgi:hypothetical protein